MLQSETVKKYDTYKDSGIEWIGKIPQEWEITHVKNYCKTVFSGGTPDTTKFEYWDGDISWLPSGEIQNCIIDTPVRYITNEGLENSSTKMIPANTTLIAMTGATCGNVGYLTFDSCANQSVTAYIAKGTTYSKFLYYLLRGAKEEILLNKTGGAQGGINVFNCKNIPVPYLSYAEQKRIADYLDEKCNNMDEVIETEKSVIEKLKEYKQSIITEAVTKGLDKSVPLKDSGIEWIGKIPQHWEVIKLKYLSTSIGDGIHSTPNYDDSGDIYFVNGNNIGQDNLIFKEDTKKINLAEFENYNKPNLSENTIFITLNGATYGKTSFYNGEIVLLGKSAGYVTLNKEQNKKYIRYYLQSNVAKFIMDLSLSGTTIANLSLATLNDFTVTYPSLTEQQQIAEYLDKKCSEIDKAIADKEQVIEKFTEYKKSLIYECVTGKRKVVE